MPDVKTKGNLREMADGGSRKCVSRLHWVSRCSARPPRALSNLRGPRTGYSSPDSRLPDIVSCTRLRPARKQAFGLSTSKPDSTVGTPRRIQQYPLAVAKIRAREETTSHWHFTTARASVDRVHNVGNPRNDTSKQPERTPPKEGSRIEVSPRRLDKYPPNHRDESCSQPPSERPPCFTTPFLKLSTPIGGLWFHLAIGRPLCRDQPDDSRQPILLSEKLRDSASR